MFHFYFNLNESIPSITDWIQVLLSAIGLIAIYLVYKTFQLQQDALKEQRQAFKLQQEALKEQQKITKIEQSRYRQAIKPIFDVELEHSRLWVEEKTLNLEVILTFTLHNENTATNVEIELPLNSGWQYRQEPKIKIDRFNFKDHLKIGCSTQQELIIVEGSEYNMANINFPILYQDIMGFTYKQDFEFNYSLGSMKTSMSDPQPLEL